MKIEVQDTLHPIFPPIIPNLFYSLNRHVMRHILKEEEFFYVFPSSFPARGAGSASFTAYKMCRVRSPVPYCTLTGIQIGYIIYYSIQIGYILHNGIQIGYPLHNGIQFGYIVENIVCTGIPLLHKARYIIPLLTSTVLSQAALFICIGGFHALPDQRTP